MSGRRTTVGGALAVVALAVVAPGCGGGSSRAADPSPAPTPLRVTVNGHGLVPQVATGVAAGGGRVLTVAHVLTPGAPISVAGHRACVLRADRRLDLALLAVRRLHGPRLRLATSGDRARIRVLRHGHPRVLRATIRRRVTAHVHAAAGTTRTRPALELAARVLPGDSGAPVTDAGGRLLGVVFARASTGGGIAWAVDAPGVSSLLRRVTAMTSSRCRR